MEAQRIDEKWSSGYFDAHAAASVALIKAKEHYAAADYQMAMAELQTGESHL
jgi:hypothetical protein